MPTTLRFDPAKLRAAREARGLSQEMLARLTGLNPSTISRIERSHHKAIHGQTLRNIVLVLGVSADSLLTED